MSLGKNTEDYKVSLSTQYQNLLIISQKKFIKLNVEIAIIFLNIKMSRIIWKI